MVQTKEQKAAYNKIWYDNNKERRAAKNKIWYDNNKERKAAKSKIYRDNNKESIAAKRKIYKDNNKESIAAKNKTYYDKNKESIAAQHKAYKKEYCNREDTKKKMKEYNRSVQGKKSNRIGKWKSRGVIGDLSKIYDERYLPSTHCEVCNKEYKCSRDKHLDHDHVSGKFRQIICCSCNILDSWKYKIIPKLSSGF